MAFSLDDFLHLIFVLKNRQRLGILVPLLSPNNSAIHDSFDSALT